MAQKCPSKIGQKKKNKKVNKEVFSADPPNLKMNNVQLFAPSTADSYIMLNQV